MEEKISGQEDKFIQDFWAFFVYGLVFMSSWVMVGSIAWLLGAAYLSLVLRGSYGLGHFVIPYLFLLVTFPFNALVCLNSWGGIRTKTGEQKKILVERKKLYLIVQLFFSVLFLVLFSGLTALILLLGLLNNYSYIDAEFLAYLVVLMIPVLLSFVSGLWYLAEFLLLRKEMIKE